MIAVIQRVSEAKVEIENKTAGHIGIGLMVLLGIEHEDREDDINWLSRKINNLRIFDEHQLPVAALSPLRMPRDPQKIVRLILLCRLRTRSCEFRH